MRKSPSKSSTRTLAGSKRARAKLAAQISVAARAGNIRALRRLLNAGGDVNAFNPYDGFFPLHSAAFAGRIEAAEFLLSCGAKIDNGVSKEAFANFTGATALMLACLEGHADVARFLISAGASVSFPSLVTYAASSGRSEIVKIVLAAGAKPSKGAIFPAAKSAKPEVVLTLVEAGSGVNQKDSLGTPLIVLACRALPRLQTCQPQLETVEILLKAGADINDGDIGECTALMYAAQCGKLSLAQFLIAHGADVNARASEDITALHWAACSGHVQIAKALLMAGANPKVVWERKGTLPMKRGTALDIARKNKGFLAVFDGMDW